MSFNIIVPVQEFNLQLHFTVADLAPVLSPPPQRRLTQPTMIVLGAMKAF